LRHVRQSLPDDVARIVACSIVDSWLDYCNSLFVGMSDRNFKKLQLCTEYISTSCPACWQIRTHHSCADSTLLAAGQTVGPVQTGFNNFQCFV